MYTLPVLIEAIADWQSKTAQQLHDALNVANVQYVDHELWTWNGIALVAGDVGAEQLRLALDAGGKGWVVYQLGGLGMDLSLDDVQAQLYALDAMGVPGMADVALATKCMITPLQANSLSNVTVENVAAAKLTLLKRDWTSRFAAILNQIGTAEQSSGLDDLDDLVAEIHAV